MSPSSRPPAAEDVVLLRGAMQNWSDLALDTCADAPGMRALIDSATVDAQTCLVAGAHSVDVVVGLASRVTALTVVTRSIPDAVTLAAALADVEGATVLCGDIAELGERGNRFDFVLAMDDLSRLVPLEVSGRTWQQTLSVLTAMIAPGGGAIIGVENELGVHRLAMPTLRRAGNTDADWAVLSTYDRSRPHTLDGLVSAVAGSGAQAVEAVACYPTWTDPTVMVHQPDALDASGHVLLSLLTTRSPALARHATDPSRIVRVAADSGRLTDFAAGWVLALGVPPVVAVARPTQVVEWIGDSEIRWVVAGQGLSDRDTGDGTSLVLAPGTELVREQLVDACASHDLPLIRQILHEYVSWMGANPILDKGRSAADLDNVARSGGDWIVLAPRPGPTNANERVTRSLADFAHHLVRRGVRHPWPAYTDTLGILGILCAMAGIEFPPDAEALLPAGLEDPRPDADPVGLAAQVQRLTEANSALRGRMEWFERRLNERERELRRIAATHEQALLAEQRRQEDLRREVSGLVASRSYRLGRALLAPARRARARLSGPQ